MLGSFFLGSEVFVNTSHRSFVTLLWIATQTGSSLSHLAVVHLILMLLGILTHIS